MGRGDHPLAQLGSEPGRLGQRDRLTEGLFLGVVCWVGRVVGAGEVRPDAGDDPVSGVLAGPGPIAVETWRVRTIGGMPGSVRQASAASQLSVELCVLITSNA